ncbi:hypothetical protein [Tenacibaculum maritimum]|uniref:hypothetical protein n=1 Tax=Tenacibaculum maritimum TaxID=107401 RepID=UPI0012E563FE|nr:hypothetical protein [Tenacibaculum maritimum]CAA0230433.1 conserved exported hypothetical protein [Tenacibaculum maritimum]CAA0249834.1 conserved exported hypothetical protein [Tenacibaculum maritimum]
MKKTLSLLALILLISVSCTKNEEEVTITPKLTVKALHDGTPLADALVKVYPSLEDLTANENAIAAFTTNDNGIAIFTNKIETDKEYFIHVEEVLGCRNNNLSFFLNFEEQYKIKIGNLSDELNTIQINTKVTGELTLKNETANGYLIKILGKEVATLAAGEELNFNHFPVEKPFFVSVINVATNQEYPLDDFKGDCSNDNTFIIN